MIDLLPKVLKSLEDVGQKESFLKFMGLIASGTFPLHSICYLLFLDIVEWFSCDSTTHMRYGHETVKLWQIGYKLEEAEPVDESFLDVSLVEEVNSNSQENYCCGVCNPGSATLDRFGMEHRREVFLIR
jgi:hypothetical protein